MSLRTSESMARQVQRPLGAPSTSQLAFSLLESCCCLLVSACGLLILMHMVGPGAQAPALLDQSAHLLHMRWAF